MRAGLKRDYVTIQRNNPTQGASGEEIDVWTNLANEWAYIRGVDGDEAITTHVIRLRHRDLDHTDRILFNSKIYDIVSVIDKDGMGRELIVEAKVDSDQ